MLIHKREGVKTHLEQRMSNSWPSGQVKLNPYSNAGQVYHGFAPAIHQLGIENERLWHNIFSSTVDPLILDVLYTVPMQVSFDTLKAYYNELNYVEPQECPASLEHFWYNVLPTRLSFDREEETLLYEGNNSEHLVLGSLHEQYILGSHIEESFIERTKIGGWINHGGGTSVLEYQPTGHWGGGAGLLYGIDAGNPMAGVSNTSPMEATDALMGFVATIKAMDSYTTQVMIVMGYNGVAHESTAFVPVTRDWERVLHTYRPDAGQTGEPFVRLVFLKSFNWSEVAICDYSLFMLESVNKNSALPYPMRSWCYREPSHAYVIVTEGENLLHQTPEGFIAPSIVVVEGLNSMGQPDYEIVSVAHNGTFITGKKWLEITGTRVDYIYPDSANVSIQLQNYQSTDAVQDFGNMLCTPNVEAPLYFGLATQNGSSILQYKSFLSGDLFGITGGYDTILPYYGIELLGTDTAIVELQDIALDSYRQLIYALSTSDTSVYIYDCLPNWPEASSIAKLQERSLSPELIINPLDVSAHASIRNEPIEVSAKWRYRNKRLLRNRWTLHKPDTSVGLLLDGSEVNDTSDYWIDNLEGLDESGEFRFHPQQITIAGSDYGDYVIELEAEYIDDELNKKSYEKDLALFSVFYKTPLTALSIPDITDEELVGIEISHDGKICIGTTTNTKLDSLSVRTLKYTRHYDYYFKETDQQLLYFRELYNKIVLGVNDMQRQTRRHIVFVNADTVLTKAEVDLGYIIINTTLADVTVTLPEVLLIDDALHGKFMRWGANLATIVPNAGFTINGDVDLELINDKEVFELTNVYTMSMWAIH